MKKNLFFLLTFVLLASCNQSPKGKATADYSTEAWSFVEAGECDSAQNAYSMYLQSGHDSLPDLEEAIRKCRFNSMIMELETEAAKQDPSSLDRIDISPEQIHLLFMEDDNQQ